MRRLSTLMAAFVITATICAAVIFPAAAQTTHTPWYTFTTDDGLATNEGYALFQDETGDIWLATDAGVSRFNGRWRTYTTASGLISNRVRAITQSRDMHSLWFATLNGVSRLMLTHIPPWHDANVVHDQASVYFPGVAMAQAGASYPV